MRLTVWCGSWLAVGVLFAPVRADDDVGLALFGERIAPVFARSCVSCHSAENRRGKLALDTAAGLLAGARDGAVLVLRKPAESALLAAIEGPDPAMPKRGEPLSATEVDAIRRWIALGAPWPDGVTIAEPTDPTGLDVDWWSLRSLVRPMIPRIDPRDELRVRTPIDRFIVAKLREQELSMSPPADRRTLIRRVYFDLIGLPPSPAVVERFVHDDSPGAYERLVDRLLASPRHGERWARHWLDVVHYGDTHGYDKDKLRPNAWPYRDWVIRAFNEDKPYARFVREQLAGDVLWPDSVDGVVATGFIAAGPWDFIGHAEVPETKIDGKVARNLDRDDMVSTAMNAFCSTTVQCARCHDHKFDPIPQEDYYGLQAVFAALDRADRPYEVSEDVARRRRSLTGRQEASRLERASLDAAVRARAGDELPGVEKRLAALEKLESGAKRLEFGYHSQISPRDDAVKWVQVDLGRSTPIDRIVYVGCHDDFNGIGAGFGFPLRYRVEVADDEGFSTGVGLVDDRSRADAPNPGVEPQTIRVGGRRARFVRITATKLAERQNDYILALGELMVLTAQGENAAAGARVTSQDSIEAPVRWARKNLVDGYYYGALADPAAAGELASLRERRRALLEGALTKELRARIVAVDTEMDRVESDLATLPAPGMVYAGTVYTGSGAFRGRGPDGGRPREIHVLARGDVRHPGKPAVPGALRAVTVLDATFRLTDEHAEGERRRALAEWVVDRRNPLTWRTIVNRVWQYHMGRGLVGTPNDFGRMGELPTHHELLDWLAVEFRDGGQSFKALHRAIVTSEVYRQSSAVRPDAARADGDARWLWRMRRRKLEAEALRDSALWLSGELDLAMYGPGFRSFVLEKPEHSPHYEYSKHDPDDPLTLRRTVYRFVVRSQPDPFLQSLDCADPSQSVATRGETLTALQALALLNHPFMNRRAARFAMRIEGEAVGIAASLRRAWRLALARDPTEAELADMIAYARGHGLPNACRVILNLNEFLFVD